MPEPVPSARRGRRRPKLPPVLVACVAALAAGCSEAEPDPRGTDVPGAPGTPAGAREVGEGPSPERARPLAAVGDSAVGCLRIGARVEEVEAACGPVQDTTIVLEGDPQDAAWVDVEGGRALAEVSGGTVWRIRVQDPRLRTPDGIGVGTPVRTLAELPDVQVAHGEGTFVRTSAHCGKSFDVEGVAFRSGGWSPDDLRALPESARVRGILVLGRCGMHWPRPTIPRSRTGRTPRRRFCRGRRPLRRTPTCQAAAAGRSLITR